MFWFAVHEGVGVVVLLWPTVVWEQIVVLLWPTVVWEPVVALLWPTVVWEPVVVLLWSTVVWEPVVALLWPTVVWEPVVVLLWRTVVREGGGVAFWQCQSAAWVSGELCPFFPFSLMVHCHLNYAYSASSSQRPLKYHKMLLQPLLLLPSSCCRDVVSC